MDQLDRPDDLRRRRVLEQEAGRARLQRAQDQLVGVEGRQHDHRGRVGLLAQQPGRGDPVDLGHPDVHQHDVGPVAVDARRARRGRRRPPPRRRSRRRPTASSAARSAPARRRRRAGRGSRRPRQRRRAARSPRPRRPARGSASPPASATRSRSPISPVPAPGGRPAGAATTPTGRRDDDPRRPAAASPPDDDATSTARARRVLARVGQPLLDDPVGGAPDRGRSTPRRPRRRARQRDLRIPAARDSSTSCRDVARASAAAARAPRPPLLAQHADHLAQLLQRRVRGGADHARRRRDLLRRRVGAELQRARVHGSAARCGGRARRASRARSGAARPPAPARRAAAARPRAATRARAATARARAGRARTAPSRRDHDDQRAHDQQLRAVRRRRGRPQGKIDVTAAARLSAGDRGQPAAAPPQRRVEERDQRRRRAASAETIADEHDQHDRDRAPAGDGGTTARRARSAPSSAGRARMASRRALGPTSTPRTPAPMPPHDGEHQHVDDPVARRAAPAGLREHRAGQQRPLPAGRPRSWSVASPASIATTAYVPRTAPTPYRSRCRTIDPVGTSSPCDRRAALTDHCCAHDRVPDGLTKRLGGRTVVSDVSRSRCEPGTVTGFLGPNGAGKTTTMRMLVRALGPRRRRTRACSAVHYRELAEPGPPRRRPARRRPPSTRGRRGARGARALRADDGRRRRAGPTSCSSSSGSTARAARKRVQASTRWACASGSGIAHALLGDPEVLILDEPANGLDPEGMRWMRGLLRDFADRGGTVLLVLAPAARGRGDRRPAA